jgi:type II secretory pathway pseudopilin PulG
MLVVLAIIVMLISILVVALGKASAGAQSANTSFLMSSITSGISQFKGDHGYVPPVLGQNGTPDSQPGWSRDLLSFDGSAGGYQNWYSVTSLAEYLLGYGGRDQDGYGLIGGITGAANPGRIESPALGIRSPGQDGVWGALFNPRSGGAGNPGGFFYRNPGNAGTNLPVPFPNTSNNSIQIDGRVYGPYLELKDPNLLGGLRPNGSIAGPEEDDYELRPKVILDYWGTPLRYHRRPYNGGDPSVYAESWNLGDIVSLRPWSVKAGASDSDGIADVNGDTVTSPELKAAGYAVLSAGPNRLINPQARIDDLEQNRDNIVEIGQ